MWTVLIHSLTFGVATYLRLDRKFHTGICSGWIDKNQAINKNQAKTHAFVRVTMFLFSLSYNDCTKRVKLYNF